MPVYEVENLTKVYRKDVPPANDAISLTINEGDILGIFGPNGAGKTTLVKQLIALLRPTSGSVRLFGVDIVARPHVVAKRVGYYGQQVVALRNYRFHEVLQMTGIWRGLPTSVAGMRAESLIERFEAGRLAGSRLAVLSGGSGG